MAGRNKGTIYRALPLALGFAATLLLFQNCKLETGSGTGQEQISSQDTSVPGNRMEGNGEGYGGKLRYISRQLNDPCADGQPKSTILVDDDLSGASIMRENCADIQPRPVSVSSLNLMAHNLANLIYGDDLFDQEVDQAAGQTMFLCRGKLAPPAGSYYAVDAKVRIDDSQSPPQFFGRVIFGIYDRVWNLTKMNDLGEVKVVPNFDPNTGHLTFDNLSEVERFHLDVFLPLMTGELFYFWQLKTSRDLPPTWEDARYVPSLQCYRQ